MANTKTDQIVTFTSNIDGVIRETDKRLALAAEEIRNRMETNAVNEVLDVVYGTDEGWYRRTGALSNSITAVVENDGKMVAVGSGLKYAPYVELGTGVYAKDGNTKAKSIPWHYKDRNGNWHTTYGMKPRPFLRPAIEKHIAEYREVLEDAMSGED